MNAKERFYSGMARETIHRITANKDNWTSFLTTMGRAISSFHIQGI